MEGNLMIELRNMAPTLPEFLQQKLSKPGAQAALARKVNKTDGAVSKWVDGSNSPNFESCLRIAQFFRIDPLGIFEMVGDEEKRNSYIELFQSQFPEFQRLEIDESDLYEREDDQILHQRLQRLLDETGHLEPLAGFRASIEREISTIQDLADFVRAHADARLTQTNQLQSLLNLSGAESGCVKSHLWLGGEEKRLMAMWGEVILVSGMELDYALGLRPTPRLLSEDWRIFKAVSPVQPNTPIFLLLLSPKQVSSRLRQRIDWMMSEWLAGAAYYEASEEQHGKLPDDQMRERMIGLTETAEVSELRLGDGSADILEAEPPLKKASAAAR